MEKLNYHSIYAFCPNQNSDYHSIVNRIKVNYNKSLISITTIVQQTSKQA